MKQLLGDKLPMISYNIEDPVLHVKGKEPEGGFALECTRRTAPPLTGVANTLADELVEEEELVKEAAAGVGTGVGIGAGTGAGTGVDTAG